MKLRRITRLLAGTSLVMASVLLAPAAETNRPPATPALSPQEFQEKLKGMTAEERQAAIRTYREQQAREARQRPRVQPPAGEVPPLTPQETETRRKELRARLEARVGALEKKKAAGTLTPQEASQLEKLQAMLKQGPELFPGDARRRELRPPEAPPRIATPPRTNSPPSRPGSAPSAKPQ
jgi:hypothetical protein